MALGAALDVGTAYDVYDAYAISLHLDLPIPARLNPSLHHVESRMPQQPNRPIPVVSHGMSTMFLLVA